MSAIFLEGNLSEGFAAHGPYPNADEALSAHDGGEGWMLTLTRPDATPERVRYGALSDWTCAYLRDARESGAIDADVSDATISREAAKLDVLVFQIASSFVDNDFDEKDVIADA